MNLPMPTWFDSTPHTTPLTSLERNQARSILLQTGWPNKKDERWKYADLSVLQQSNFILSQSPTISLTKMAKWVDAYRLKNTKTILLVLIDGYFIPALSDLNNLPPDTIMCNLELAYEQYPDLVQACRRQQAKPHVFAHLNQAMWQDGIFIFVPAGYVLAEPIHLLSIATNTQSKSFITHTRHLIYISENASISLLEEQVSIDVPYYMRNLVSLIAVKAGAKLNYCKRQEEGKQAIHIAHTTINQAENSEVNSTCFSSGSVFAREDLIVNLNGRGASCQAACFYDAKFHHQYLQHQVEVEHAADYTYSDLLYKGILNNKSRAVFNGRLLVKKDVHQIKAHQANHNLLLSPLAEIYSKPMLEIYADDVQCQHGATSGELDKAALFYLCSRGIPTSIAIDILLQGFMQEIIDHINIPAIERHIAAKLMEKLG